MAYEQRDNSGALFRNEKAENDRHPTHKGSVMVGGVEYWIAAWVKEGAKGRFFSLSFEAKEEKYTAAAKTDAAPAGDGPNFDEDVPF